MYKCTVVWGFCSVRNFFKNSLNISGKVEIYLWKFHNPLRYLLQTAPTRNPHHNNKRWYSDLHADEVVLTALLWWSKVKLGQTQWSTDLVAGVWVEEESHPARTKVTISIHVAWSCVNLRVSPQVTHSLYVDYNHLMTWTFEREVTECLSQEHMQLSDPCSR